MVFGAQQTKTNKILVVDDDLDTLKLVGTTLEKQGFIIVAAKDGQEALEKVAQHMPDLILLDIMMPKMDGYEVTRRLRADPATSAIPIILFTAKAQVDDKVAGLDAGADEYLTKPTHPAELIARVKALLKRPVTSMLPPLQGMTGSLAGMVVGVIAAKGGQGVSTLAINLGAGFLQQNKNATIVVAELRPGRGNIGVFLGLTKTQSLNDLLVRSPGEIHRAVVEKALVSHKSGLKLLLTSIKPSDAKLETAAEQTNSVVRELSRLASFSILDLGDDLPTGIQKALEQCNYVVVVAEPDLRTMQKTRALLDDLKALKISGSKVLVAMVNRVRIDTAMSAAEVQKELGRNLDAVFTPAPELAFQADRAHEPMITIDPQSYTAQQVNKLVALMSGLKT